MCFSATASFSAGALLHGLGTLALLSFAATYFLYTTWFISVWCFFAAILSVIVFLHLVLRRGEHNGLRHIPGNAVFNLPTAPANAQPDRKAAT